jgi:ribosomal protein L27
MALAREATTLFALRPGIVEFHDSRGRKFARVQPAE